MNCRESWHRAPRPYRVARTARLQVLPAPRRLAAAVERHESVWFGIAPRRPQQRRGRTRWRAPTARSAA
eukprot:scaffold218653_cov35-Tisochrysis_lutea.AAC.4